MCVSVVVVVVAGTGSGSVPGTWYLVVVRNAWYVVLVPRSDNGTWYLVLGSDSGAWYMVLKSEYVSDNGTGIWKW